MLEIEEAFNILEEEYKKQKTLLNKIHIIKEYLFDLEADLEEEKAENNEKAEIINKAIDYIENNSCLFNGKIINGIWTTDKELINGNELLEILRGEDDESN